MSTEEYAAWNIHELHTENSVLLGCYRYEYIRQASDPSMHISGGHFEISISLEGHNTASRGRLNPQATCDSNPPIPANSLSLLLTFPIQCLCSAIPPSFILTFRFLITPFCSKGPGGLLWAPRKGGRPPSCPKLISVHTKRKMAYFVMTYTASNTRMIKTQNESPN